MSEEKTNVLDQALANVLIQASEGIEKASEFVLAEIPDVAAQALLWYGVYNFILFVVGVLLFVFAAIGYTKAASKVIATWDDMSADGVIGCILLGVVSSAVIAIALSRMINLTWLKIWIAPKLWMIEYAASIVK